MSDRKPLMVWLVMVEDPREESGYSYWAGGGVASFWRQAVHYSSEEKAERVAEAIRREGARAHVEPFTAPGVNEREGKR